MEWFHFLIFALLCNVLPHSAYWAVDDIGCRTPDRAVGYCISVYSCPTLTDFLLRIDFTSLDENLKEYIRGFFCGVDALGLKVCCPYTPFNFNNVFFNRYIASTSKPKKCRTTAEDEGTCIELRSCSTVTSLISKIKNSFDVQRNVAIRRYPCKFLSKRYRAMFCAKLINFETAINETENDEMKSALDLYRCGEDSERPMVCCPAYTVDPALHPNLELLLKDDCVFAAEVMDPNILTGMIDGGSYARLFEFPWMVALKYTKDNKAGLDYEPEEFNCGAVLISNRYLLTAAHCVMTKKISLAGARLGEIDLNNAYSDQKIGGPNYDDARKLVKPKDFEITVEDAIVHPDYNRTLLINDIALIRLREHVETSRSISPICLPIRVKSRSKKLQGNVVVTGWGETENAVRSMKLLKINVPVVPPKKCSKYYANMINITNKQLCAGGKDGRDTCRGDSGGPLMQYRSFEFTEKCILYGIVSFGHKMCAKGNIPGVYTRVTSYLNWILDNMKP